MIEYPLITADQLVQQIDAVRPVILDASWHMPAEQRDAEAEFERCRIAGARFFDFDGRVCDCITDLPHMLPEPAEFAREVQHLGVSAEDSIVCYDSKGFFSAARAWWMFVCMGHTRVVVLNGGLPRWRELGGAVDSGPVVEYEAGDFKARFQSRRVCDRSQVAAALNDPSVCIVDARPADRFTGRAPEPRAGLRSGHIPGSLNLPFSNLIADGLLHEREVLEPLFMTANPQRKRMIFTCGSGVTAAALAFAASVCGYDDWAVYDGSWSDWGREGLDTPVAKENASR